MHKSERWLPLGLVLTLGLLLGLLGFSVWEKMPTSVERVVWSQQAQWIAPQTPNYRFYARHTFNLPDNAKSGWLRISADNDFTLYVNKRQIARENSALNNSLGLGGGVRIPFQGINDSNRYETKTSVNYLLASSNDWKLTTYIDLTPHLRPGKNAIALEIQKGQTNPRVVVEGAIYPVADTTPINLTTGATTWRVSNLSETHHSLQWYDVDFPDTSWSEARLLGSIKEATYSRLSKNLFDRNLQGNWLTGIPNSKGEEWLRGAWEIPTNPITHAYIRFAGKGQYSLLLNGTLINHYGVEDSSQLHLIEVTKLLKTGNNFLAVSLASSLEAASSGSNPVNPNGYLNFFLDGWAETEQGEIVGAIATDNTWTTVNQPVSGWIVGAGESQPVTLLGLPNGQEFQRNFEGNAYLLNYPNYLWHQSLWQFGGITFAVVYASLLGSWLRDRGSWWDKFTLGTAILSPGTLFLIAIGLLKHRFAEAEVGLLFAQPQSNYLILLGFTAIVVLTLLSTNIKRNISKLPLSFIWFSLGLVAYVSFSLAVGGNVFVVFSLGIVVGIFAFIFILMRRQGQSPILVLQNTFNFLRQKWPIWGEWSFLILIVGVGFGLRVYHLGLIDLDSDENTSLDATRGILRTGAPIATSGIWYSRGPFYHYLLACWLRLVGDSVINARFLSVILGTATLLVVYVFARKVTGKVWIALLVTAILSINPWELWYSRNIRFYQLLQFMTILSFWSFIKGFIEQAGRRYQYIFFIVMTLTLLSQEISLTLLPAFLIGFLCFYRPFRLVNDWQILLGSFMTLTIFIYCLGFSSIRLLTPLAALSESTAAYIRLHFSDITALTANFFIGSDRMQIFYSILFFVGLLYFLKLRNNLLSFLSISVILQIILVTILCYNPDERYVYSIYPIFVLLAVYSAICITESLGKSLDRLLNGFLPLRVFALSLTILLVFINIQPARTLASYKESINRRNTQIFEYIRTHKQPEDVVIAPLPSLAVSSLGKLDYFLMGTGYFDATYWHEGRLIDRWAGGAVISNLDQMNHVLEKHKRVWIHLEDTRKGRFNLDTWQYIETLGKPVIDSFGTRLRLWQPEDGFPSRIPNQGKDLGAY